MVIMSADVTKEIKGMVEELVDRGIYKSQSEAVRDAIRQLSYKYGAPLPLKGARSLTTKAQKKKGESLSQAVRKLREEV